MLGTTRIRAATSATPPYLCSQAAAIRTNVAGIAGSPLHATQWRASRRSGLPHDRNGMDGLPSPSSRQLAAPSMPSMCMPSSDKGKSTAR